MSIQRLAASLLLPLLAMSQSSSFLVADSSAASSSSRATDSPAASSSSRVADSPAASSSSHVADSSAGSSSSHVADSPVGSVARSSGSPALDSRVRPTPTDRPSKSSAGTEPCDNASIDLPEDRVYENAISWQFEGVLAPDLGALAQVYPARRILCGVVLDLTQNGGQATQRMDLYIWDNDSGRPGAVRALVTAANPGPVATWPIIGRHVLALPEPTCAEVDSVWVGYWPSWIAEPAGWFVGADLDGPPTRSVTKIAPGLGFPSGWQNTSTAWGPVSTLGIGLSFAPCVPDPVISSTWGSIKSLFR